MYFIVCTCKYTYLFLQKALNKTVIGYENKNIKTSALFPFQQNFRVKNVHISSSELSCEKRSHQCKYIVKQSK